MSLPRVKQPVYEYNGIEYRGFTHAEEKILLQIKEDNNDLVRYKNIKKIMEQCTFGKVDLSKIDTTTFEMLFIKIRAKSAGEIHKIKYKCKNAVGTGEEKRECGNEFIVVLNLEEIDVVKPDEEVDEIIRLDDELQMKMKPASIDSLLQAGTDQDKQLMAYIDCVFDDEQVYKFEDMEEDEIMVFLESIPTIKKKEIHKFIDNQPKTQAVVSETCKACGKEHKLTLSGLNNFFG